MEFTDFNNVNFTIQKLKNKHTFLKKYTNWVKLSSLILTEREETPPTSEGAKVLFFKSYIFEISACQEKKMRHVSAF